MRTITTAQDRALTSDSRSHHVRVSIDSTGSGAWVYLTDLQGVDWVRGCTITEDVDTWVGREAMMRLSANTPELINQGH